MMMDPSEEYRLAESEGSAETDAPEKTQDASLKGEERRKKARLRRRGPYRKAHVNW
jgi:hypothetical protein